jgi:hypothetical protein
MSDSVTMSVLTVSDSDSVLTMSDSVLAVTIFTDRQCLTLTYSV